MKVLLLAAGKSNRFKDFTTLGHKSLLTIVGKPLIVHTLESIKKSGITDVIIVEDEKHLISDVVGNGENLGLSIKYVTHIGSQGMGAALLDAKEFLNGDFLVSNPYHVNFTEFVSDLKEKKQNAQDIVLLGKKDNNLGSFGALDLDGDTVKGIVEKPTDGKPGIRVVGIYLLNDKFLETLAAVNPHHYSLESAISEYAKRSSVKVHITEKLTLSLKYPWDALAIKNYLLEKLNNFVSPKAIVSRNCVIEGIVYIEEGVKIMEGVCIKGPCYIGKNAFVGNNALLRDGVSVEENTLVGSFIEVKNTLIGKGSTTHTGLIEDSIIGIGCKIAAGILTANVRLDRKSISALVNEKKIDSKLTALGMILGDDARLGARVTTMPGILVGKGARIGPSTTLMKNIMPDSTFYTQFENFIEEVKHE